MTDWVQKHIDGMRAELECMHQHKEHMEHEMVLMVGELVDGSLTKVERKVTISWLMKYIKCIKKHTKQIGKLREAIETLINCPNDDKRTDVILGLTRKKHLRRG